MKEHSIKSSGKLFDLLHDYKHSTAWMFRGQKDASWEVLPKAGRKEFALKYQGGVTERACLNIGSAMLSISCLLLQKTSGIG
jgi:hypothetical protein